MLERIRVRRTLMRQAAQVHPRRSATGSFYMSSIQDPVEVNVLPCGIRSYEVMHMDGELWPKYSSRSSLRADPGAVPAAPDACRIRA